MKVYEVISQSGQLDEGLGSLLVKFGIKAYKAGKLLTKGGRTFKTVLTPITSGLYRALTVLGLVRPVYIYYEKTSANEALLAADQITKAEFDSRRQADMAVLMESLITYFASRTITFIMLGPLRFIFGILPITRPIAVLLRGLDKTTAVAALAAINSQTGREILAKALTIPIIGEGAEAILGGGMTAIISKLKELISGKDDPLKPGATDKYPNTGNAQVGATSSGSDAPAPVNPLAKGWNVSTGYNTN